MPVLRNLPVYQHRSEIIKALEENQVLIIESPTGSGKTTQLPIILKEAKYDEKGIIGITQPRRIAALSISDFIKKQLELDKDDHYCAYTMRFDDTSDSSTKIKVMTDGILLQELKSNPYLTNYSVIMVDEAHERSLNIDFILGLLKQICEVRPELKIIISSATINTEIFSAFFNNAPIISIKANAYPVEIIYDPLKLTKTAVLGQEDYQHIKKIAEKSIQNNDGDILVFLPGEYDILQVSDCLKSINRETLIIPLYGRLSKEEQEKVFLKTPEGKTKIVVATNIAETSITIDGIRVVIDSGLAKMNFYNQKNFTSSLDSMMISKSSSIQRAGRAGRTQSGICYRLYSEEIFSNLAPFSTPEILRSDLAEVMFRMSELGIYDYENFPFITAPKRSAIESAELTLNMIDAIDNERKLTKVGELMKLFPLLPRHSRVLTQAITTYPEVLYEILIAISFLSTKSPFLRPKDKEEIADAKQATFQDAIYGDFVGYLKLFNAYKEIDTQKGMEKFCKLYYLDVEIMNEIVHIQKQLEEIVSLQNIPITKGGSVDSYLTCLISGLIQFVCYRYRKNTYRSITADEIYLHPSSSWFVNPPQFILAGEIVQTSRMFARSVSPLKKEYFSDLNKELLPKLINEKPGKKEREKESTRKKDFATTLEIYQRNYQYSFSKGSIDYKTVTIPINDLPYLISEGHKKGKAKSIKVELSSFYKGKEVFSIPMKLKEVIQEGSLIPIKEPIEGIEDKSFNIFKSPNEANEFIKKYLFHPLIIKGGAKKKIFGFLGINYYAKGIIYFANFKRLSDMLDSAFFTLSKMKPNIKDKKLKDTCSKIIKDIQSLEDF